MKFSHLPLCSKREHEEEWKQSLRVGSGCQEHSQRWATGTQQAHTPTSAGLALAAVVCLFIKHFGIKTQKDAVEITKIKRKKHITYSSAKETKRCQQIPSRHPALTEHLCTQLFPGSWRWMNKPQSSALWPSQSSGGDMIISRLSQFLIGIACTEKWIEPSTREPRIHKRSEVLREEAPLEPQLEEWDLANVGERRNNQRAFHTWVSKEKLCFKMHFYHGLGT